MCSDPEKAAPTRFFSQPEGPHLEDLPFPKHLVESPDINLQVSMRYPKAHCRRLSTPRLALPRLDSPRGPQLLPAPGTASCAPSRPKLNFSTVNGTLVGQRGSELGPLYKLTPHRYLPRYGSPTKPQKVLLALDTRGKHLVGPHPQKEDWTFKPQFGFQRNRIQIY